MEAFHSSSCPAPHYAHGSQLLCQRPHRAHGSQLLSQRSLKSDLSLRAGIGADVRVKERGSQHNLLSASCLIHGIIISGEVCLVMGDPQDPIP